MESKFNFLLAFTHSSLTSTFGPYSIPEIVKPQDDFETFQNYHFDRRQENM